MDNNNEFIHEDEQQSNKLEVKSKAVTPSRGFYWLERGLSQVYAPQFRNWFISSAIYLLLSSLALGLVPLLGLILFLIAPLFMAGAYLGAHHFYESQQKVSVLQYFKAFSHPNASQLYLLSLILLVLGFLGFELVYAIYSDIFNTIDLEKLESGQQAYLIESSEILAPVFRFGILLYLVFLFLTWFSMSLILFNDKNAFVAITESFVACLKNILPFVVLIVILVILYLITSLLLYFILLMFPGIPPLVMNTLTLSFMILWFPVYFAASYIAYREVFLGDIMKSEKSL